MIEETIPPTYLCRRIHQYVHVEKMEDITQRVIVHCDYYKNPFLADRNKRLCLLDKLNPQECFPEINFQRKEAKVKLRL